MKFLDFATEIRLSIYSELLVLDEPIVFVTDDGPSSPPFFRSIPHGLCPALLRSCSRVYREASPLLYSNNRFRFPQIITNSAHIAPFLCQVGPQASLIYYISIAFPTFDYPRSGGIRLQKEHIKNLELIRDACTSIRTLELFVSPDHGNYALNDSETVAEPIDLLEARFKTIPSLKEIIINFEVYPEEDLDDDLTKKMHDYGWAVTTTKLPKKVWISSDGRVECDNEEDCIAYDNELLQRKVKEKQKAEEEWWEEEYYRRRRDPYWKNDSDYD